MKTVNKYKEFYYTLSIIVCLGFISCSKVLENTDKSRLTEATQWISERNADIFLNDIYNNLPSMYNSPENLDNYTDDNDAGFYYPSWRFKQGILDPASTDYSIWSGAVGAASIDRFNWGAGYTTIRKCNTFIQAINENKNNYSLDWFNKRLDEVRFLRSFFYANLFQHIGGLPIITAPQSRNDDGENLLIARSTFEETLNFIRALRWLNFHGHDIP